MTDRPKQISCSQRAHDLAERIDPDGNKGRCTELALEVLALVEWRGRYKEIGEGPQTRFAEDVLAATRRIPG